MTKSEKALVLKFLNQMACHVGTHTGDMQEPDYNDCGLYASCVADDKDEIATYNRLANIVGIRGVK